jgi:hypothetical protein
LCSFSDKTNSLIPRFWHSSSKIAKNSEPPSTCIALTGKGSLLSRVSRKGAAVLAKYHYTSSDTQSVNLAGNTLKTLCYNKGELRGYSAKLTTESKLNKKQAKASR